MKQLFKKLFCCHEWKILHKVRFLDSDVVLLCCTKCGKLKKKVVW